MEFITTRCLRDSSHNPELRQFLQQDLQCNLRLEFRQMKTQASVRTRGESKMLSDVGAVEHEALRIAENPGVTIGSAEHAVDDLAFEDMRHTHFHGASGVPRRGLHRAVPANRLIDDGGDESRVSLGGNA